MTLLGPFMYPPIDVMIVWRTIILQSWLRGRYDEDISISLGKLLSKTSSNLKLSVAVVTDAPFFILSSKTKRKIPLLYILSSSGSKWFSSFQIDKMTRNTVIPLLTNKSEELKLSCWLRWSLPTRQNGYSTPAKFKDFNNSKAERGHWTFFLTLPLFCEEITKENECYSLHVSSVSRLRVEN